MKILAVVLILAVLGAAFLAGHSLDELGQRLEIVAQR